MEGAEPKKYAVKMVLEAQIVIMSTSKSSFLPTLT